MRTILKDGAESILDSIVDGILAFTDYFVTRKRISLSETTMFLFSLSWTLWFMFRGVYVAEMPLARWVWTTLFATATLSHLISFFFDGTKIRAYVACIYGIIWCFLTFLSLYTGSVAPAVPTLAVFTFLSVFIAVRLFREVPTA